MTVDYTIFCFNDFGMTNVENENKRDSNHEFNLYVDRQLQNQLLQVDDDSDTESYEIKLSKSGSNIKNASKQFKGETKIDDITGWFPRTKFIARKPDVISNAKPDTAKTSTFIHPWKDYRAKKEESFVFKHYTEHRKYIEQYRNEHGCQNSRFPSGNMYGDSRRIAFQVPAFVLKVNISDMQIIRINLPFLFRSVC